MSSFASAKNSAPRFVGETPRVLRLKSSSPSSRSSSRTALLKNGWLTKSASAAREMEPQRSTSTAYFSC